MRKVCIVTGTRAEYGLLYWLMKEIQSDEDLELQIIATGMHLSPEFGLTYKFIEQDGFIIQEKVEMLLSGDTPTAIAKSMSLGLSGVSESLLRLKPDILVILGDRFEAMVAAQAAMICKIPIAHLHGGEATEGVIDEAIRHSITKMSHMHFTATEEYRNRVIQLGEAPNTVFNVGATGIDNIKKLKFLSRDEIEKCLNFKFGKLNILVTYHPVTLSNRLPLDSFNELLSALNHFPDAKVIFTKTNADANGRQINKAIDDYVNQNPNNTVSSTSLGQVLYLSVLSEVDIVLGNSSSGIIEAPALKKATINIGQRQQGRLRELSIIDCDESAISIQKAIEKAHSTEFINLTKNIISQYGEGNTSERIKNILKSINLENILFKRFYNIKNIKA